MKISGSVYLFMMLLFFASLIPAQGTGQVNVVPVGPGTLIPEKNGIFYALPRNVVKLQITVSKTETFKGPYADFAAKYLGLNAVITKNKVSYTVEDVKFDVLAETDPGHYYFIELDEKSKSGRSLLFTMNEQGFITGFSDAAQLSGREQLKVNGQSGIPGSPFIDLLQPSVLEKVDTIVRRISVDTNTFEEIFVRRSISEKSAEQQARETAEMIRKIEENKFNLITGYQEVNYSKDALEFMMLELEKAKQDYLALFKGVSRTSLSQHTFYITPSENPEGMLETICGFSATAGITARNAPGAESVSLLIESMNQTTAIRDFIGQRALPSKGKRGFYYRIPEKVRISLKAGERVVAHKEAMIAQMGEVTYLPSGIFSYIKLNPLTGGIELIASE